MRHVEGDNEIEEDDQVLDVPNQFEQPVFINVNKERTEKHQQEESKQTRRHASLLNRGEMSLGVAPSEIELKELSIKKQLEQSSFSDNS